MGSGEAFFVAAGFDQLLPACSHLQHTRGIRLAGAPGEGTGEGGITAEGHSNRVKRGVPANNRLFENHHQYGQKNGRNSRPYCNRTPLQRQFSFRNKSAVYTAFT
ncbi:hypothetical protein D3C76_1546350 [compost metagenome]